MIKKIAVPTDITGNLDAHFGHCKFFEIFEVKDDVIIASEKIVPPPHEPGVLPKWLAEIGATDILAGGMGNKAIQIFNQHGVNVFVGAPQLKSRKLVEGYLTKTIGFSANYCDH